MNRQLSLDLQSNEIAQLDLLREIDHLAKYIAVLYIERNYKAVTAHIPHLTRRWDALNRLLIQREKLVELQLNPPLPRQAPKPPTLDYTGSGYDYN